MKLSYLIVGLFIFLAACGDEKTRVVKLGPKTQKELDDTKKLAADGQTIEARAAAVKNLLRSRAEQSLVDGDRPILRRKSFVEAGTKREIPVYVFSGKLIDFGNLRRAVSDAQAEDISRFNYLSEIDISETLGRNFINFHRAYPLDTSVEQRIRDSFRRSSAANIFVVAEEFVWDGDLLKTNGSNFFIFAEKVSIKGRISTANWDSHMQPLPARGGDVVIVAPVIIADQFSSILTQGGPASFFQDRMSKETVDSSGFSSNPTYQRKIREYRQFQLGEQWARVSAKNENLIPASLKDCWNRTSTQKRQEVGALDVSRSLFENSKLARSTFGSVDAVLMNAILTVYEFPVFPPEGLPLKSVAVSGVDYGGDGGNLRISSMSAFLPDGEILSNRIRKGFGENADLKRGPTNNYVDREGKPSVFCTQKFSKTSFPKMHQTTIKYILKFMLKGGGFGSELICENEVQEELKEVGTEFLHSFCPSLSPLQTNVEVSSVPTKDGDFVFDAIAYPVVAVTKALESIGLLASDIPSVIGRLPPLFTRIESIQKGDEDEKIKEQLIQSKK